MTLAAVMPMPRCAYCGKRARSATCAQHSDLPAIDPDWTAFTARRLKLLLDRIAEVRNTQRSTVRVRRHRLI